MIRMEGVHWRAAGAGGFRLHIPSLSLRPGITVLVGPNGAGKTSLMRLLATATEAHAGDILYSGHRLRDALPLIRRNVGYMPAGLELYDSMTARKLLSHLAELKGLGDPAEPVRMLLELELAHLGDTKVRRLSHGQRQRLGIAQSMLGRPPFLFLDEPLNYLDALEAKRVQFALLRQAPQSVILVSTHELNEWETYADRVLWLENGRLAADIPLKEWVSGVKSGVGVYEGKMPVDAWKRLDKDKVLRVRAVDGTAHVRLLGPPPTDWFKPAELTMEEAYLIRRREWLKEKEQPQELVSDPGRAAHTIHE